MSVRDQNGGESERLAPVTPLFGGLPAAGRGPARMTGAGPHRGDADAGSADRGGSATANASGSDWHRTWRDEPRGGRASGASLSRLGDDEASGEGSTVDDETDAIDASGGVEAAEAALLRKLRARSLSVQEARTALGGRGLSREQIDEILAETVRLGYLDDRALAEQLVHAGQDRRGQGRQAIGQTLAKRGVPRDVADAVLAELPDDDMERALEFARRKAGGIGGRDAQAELRRLAGQLSRRGYPSHVALSAARQALDER